jgi:hypothetical protein
MCTPLKRGMMTFGALAALYLLTYIGLSCSGGYVLTQSGELRYSFGWSVSDIEQWQPRFLFCQRFRQIDGSRTIRANTLGYVFTPLVLLDQAVWHKTVRLFDGADLAVERNGGK